MITIDYQKFIMRKDLKNNPDKIYVFGDNDHRSGYGGQAKEMRGESNAIGIRVKKSPSMSSNAFYTDDEYSNNIKKISDDLITLYNASHYKIIVFPSNGIGTGYAMLSKTAPRTFLFLNTKLYEMFGIHNGSNSIIKLRQQMKSTCKCKRRK